MPKNVQKAIGAYVLAHVVHWVLSEAIGRESRKHGWTAGQIEAAKLVVGGVMLFV